MKKQYLECGQIVAVHGLKGEVRVNPWGGTPEELTKFDTLFFDEGKKRVRIERARVQNNIVIMKLEGIDMPEAAQKIRNQILYMDREMDTLDDGQYYVQDLIGIEVYDVDSGVRYGRLVWVSETGANDVYHIEFEDGSEKLIPAIPQVVTRVDFEQNRMEIRPLEGLFEI